MLLFPNTFNLTKPRLITKISLGFAFLFAINSYSEPPNLALVKKAVIEYKRSNEYIKDIDNVIQKANNYIQLFVKRHKNQKNLAIVLDIDETSLSNYETMEKKNFFLTSKDLHNMTVEAKATAIEPVLNMYKQAIANNIFVFFITGRKELERQATIKNLKTAGYTKWQGLYLRGKNQTNLAPAIYKTQVRKQIDSQGYKIIACIGDQLSDCKGEYTGKVFKLPNPYYFLP